MRFLLLPLIALVSVGCAAKSPVLPGPLGQLGRAPRAPVAARLPEPPPEADRGEATLQPPDDRRPTTARGPTPGSARLARAATFYVGHKPRGHRDDCSGFVNASYERAGADIDLNTAGYWALAEGKGATHRRLVPKVGDLAFFDNTYDRDRDGRLDDTLTHVAIVTEVLGDGTIVMAHGGTSKGRTTLRMNLKRPTETHDDEGRVLNEPLRARTRRDKPGTPYLASELWRGFAALPPESLQ